MILFLLLISGILLYVAICTGYLLLFAVAGRLAKPLALPLKNEKKPAHKIAVFIPAYKEDAVITEVARQSLLQSYPKSLYEVVIICDSLQLQTMAALRQLPVKLVEVQFSNPTKAKALNAALQQLPAFDIAVVLDADNIMDRHFLAKISHTFSQGASILQGHRIAKNTNTSIAILDAISEEINNHIFRKGHCALGLSSALIGSGMAFDYGYFKETMATINAISGFDKELELAILKEKKHIYYLEDAFVYDEKVQRIADFKNQRTRWIAAQMKYLSMHFSSGIKQLLRGNIDYSDKVFQFMLPPRVLMLGILISIILVLALMQQIPLLLISSATLFVLILTLYLATPGELLKKITWKEISNIPVLVVQFAISLWQIRKARYTFLHTPHGKIKQK